MGAKELFDAGNLTGAIKQLTEDVKASPRDVRSRIFLFELLCFAGEFQRAERQLDAIAQTSGEINVEMGVVVYRQLLQAESARREVFTTGRQPTFLREPPDYVTLHMQALTQLKENRPDDVESLLRESSLVRQPLKGRVDGKAFDNIRDCDDLLAPFVEGLFQNGYVWIPLEQVKQIDIQPPRTLRDLLWIPARIELVGQPLGDIFLPAQYQGSSQHPDDLVKLGRMTDWKAIGEETCVGAGQHMFLVDDEEHPLLDIRQLELTSSS